MAGFLGFRAQRCGQRFEINCASKLKLYSPFFVEVVGGAASGAVGGERAEGASARGCAVGGERAEEDDGDRRARGGGGRLLSCELGA